VSAVCDLSCLGAGARYCAAVAGTSITGDDIDPRMGRQPGFHCGRVSIGQEVDDASASQVADDGAIAVTTLPREAVDADNGRLRRDTNGPAPPNQTEQGVTADR
jgi:hypothetical protein